MPLNETPPLKFSSYATVCWATRSLPSEW